MLPQLTSQASWNRLIQGASILQGERYGVKVYLLPNQDVIKLFRIKRLFSLSFVYPYSMRFARNGRRLQSRGIPAVQTKRIFYCNAIKRHGVIYPLLPGKTLYSLFDVQKPDPVLMSKLAEFMVKLHDKGVYFRSLHLGNVVQMPEGQFGLIDIADLRFFPWSLALRTRARNFRHLFRSADYSGAMKAYGYERFVQDYLAAAKMPQKKREQLKALLLQRSGNWV